MNGLAPQSGVWQEARAPDGRVYYYNSQTKATQWTKPAEMMNASERALTSSPWKEYNHNGRKYWHNTETNQTTWEMPDVLKNAQGQQPPSLPPTPVKAVAPTFVSAGATSFQDNYRQREDYDRPISYGTSAITQDQEYSSFDEAEAVFHKVLRKNGVQPDWTWEQTIRACVRDPQYRAIKDPKDRKTSFEKYVAEVRAQEKDREKDRQAKLRTDFYTMLKSHPEIRYYTRWNTAKSIIQGETIFRSARTEQEAQAIFIEYRADLLKSHQERESQQRKTALDQLIYLLQSLELEPYTKWSEAQKILNSNPRFQGDETFQSLPKIDILKAFENHVKALERTFNDKRQKQKSLKARQERQNRDKFVALLNELRSGGKIKANSKWIEIHSLIEDDPRYINMLGQSGSSPLELFWDVIEEEDRNLRTKRNDALDVLEDQRYELTSKTTFEEFSEVMTSDRRTASIPTDNLRLIFNRLREKVLRRNDEGRHAQRRAVDNLRSRIKHLDPPITSTDTYEQVRPRIDKFDEYHALDSDDLRRQAFDKAIRRIKEREEEDRDRRDRRSHDEPSRRGDSRRSRQRSRSPEHDAYAADRKKAQADRERQYRKGSQFGLSPPPSAAAGSTQPRRDGTDRYVPSENSRHRSRERNYRNSGSGAPYLSRADPRDAATAAELDYGDGSSTPTVKASSVSGRRRREHSDEEEGEERDPKRRKSEEDHDSKSEKEDVAYRSGSEEGEIEEE